MGYLVQKQGADSDSAEQEELPVSLMDAVQPTSNVFSPTERNLSGRGDRMCVTRWIFSFLPGAGSLQVALMEELETFPALDRVACVAAELSAE